MKEDETVEEHSNSKGRGEPEVEEGTREQYIE
jgi:hypothetical protein